MKTKLKFKFNIKRELKIAGALAVVAGIIVFTERRQGTGSIHDITIKMENVHENHFMEEADVAGLMQLSTENLRGASMSKVNLKNIEKKIKSEPFIQDADLYSDLKGNLVVKVALRRPIARITRNDGPDGYIAEDGTVMPVSERYNTRVILLSGNYVRVILQQDNINSTETGKQIMTLINTINEDEFWRAQIAELEIDSHGKVTLFPQVGDEKIEFGKADNIELKLSKLMIFYKEILPRVGWNKYNRVNLEYEGQIVAE
jgi:cell division protein FtsQ